MSIAIDGALSGARSPASAAGFPWRRIAKVTGALAMLGLGAYAVTSDQLAIATDNAVVSAYSVSVRTPIDGVVGGTALRIGEKIARGTILAEVHNSRMDDQRLVDLRGHLTKARASLDATEAELRSLGALHDDMARRTRAYLAASSARLAGSIAEAENALAGATEQREQAQRTLTRRSSLAQTGVSSAADLDKARSDFKVAAHEVGALQGRLDALSAQAKAAEQGVIAETGSNDVTYSAQRADEIDIRVGELTRERALQQAEIEETLARLSNEEERVSKLQAAALVAPASGIIWKLKASDGERLGTGDSVAQIVDCASAFIIAIVPQNRVPDIAVGSEVEYRLSGDSARHQGRVLSITGDATGGDQNLAAVPFEQKGTTATVRIALEGARDECLVGRTARVILPSARTGLARLFGRLF
jgi:multidrug resistance efflux pump